MPVEMRVNRIPDDEDRPEVRHAREVDKLKEQCDRCKLKRPDTPTKDCAIRVKLVVDDSEVGWKHRHLFLDGLKCKMHQPKEAKLHGVR